MEAYTGREDHRAMSRRPATFTKADLSRAMAVARENGMTVEVLPDGTLRIVPLGSEQRAMYHGEIRL